jgi:hypothetical protein
MNIRWYAGLFAVSLLVLLGVAWLEISPGYMDADYYFASGLRIAINYPAGEPFIWNYLAEPEHLPHPVFTYWMPMAGYLAAYGIKLTGSMNFWSARILFLIVAAAIAPLTAFLAYTFTPKKWAALLAGSLAIVPGFYLVYLPTTETFAVYMLLGGIIFLLIGKLQQDIGQLSSPGEGLGQSTPTTSGSRSPLWVYIVAGFVAGLMYMTRADGIIWLLIVLAGIISQANQYRYHMRTNGYLHAFKPYWLPILLCSASFLIVASPWMFRNLNSFGSLFAPGSGKALWLTGYDELYAFPSSQLTYSRWLNQGLGAILQARWWALGLNLGTLLAVQGGIFLLPFVVVGLWVKRSDWRVGIGIAGWFVVLLVMTFVFPFQGARGGFFHTGAAFQTMLWALIPVGLFQFIQWGQRTRNWTLEAALKNFSFLIVGVVFILTVFLSWQRLAGSALPGSAWGATSRLYQQVESYLDSQGVSDSQIIMVNNPPGYYAVNKRQAIVIPDGDLATLNGAAEKFGSSYLVIDENYPQALEDLYKEPRDYPGLVHLGSISGAQIYYFSP